MNKKLLIVIGLLMSGTSLLAQQTFRGRATLPKVDTSGFYAIGLTPDILARSQSGLADIRLYDGNKFTPYLFGSELPVKDIKSFVEFPQVKAKPQNDTTSAFIAENKAHLIVGQLYIKLKNTAVSRTLSLSGSDDLNNWYAIKENVELASAANDKGVGEQLLDFPFSNYRYFKIESAHKNKEPIAILQAGIYTQVSDAPGYIQIPVAQFTQKDSAKSSAIIIRFKDNYPINKIHLDIAAPKFYRRKINVYQFNGKYFTLVTDADISSSGTPDLTFSAKTKAVELEIMNEDNPPLSVKSVAAFQLTQKVIAYLEQGKQYQLFFGDSSATAPSYDLKFFADSLQRNLPQLNSPSFEANPLYQPKQIKESKVVIPSWAIWIAIATVIIVLVMLTLKMTNEVRKRDAEV